MCCGQSPQIVSNVPSESTYLEGNCGENGTTEANFAEYERLMEPLRRHGMDDPVEAAKLILAQCGPALLAAGCKARVS